MRSMFLLGISLSLLYVHTLLLHAEEKERDKPIVLVPSQMTFTPSTYFVGDRVTLRVILEVSRQKDLVPPRSIPPLSWGVVHQINLLPLKADKGYELILVFTPYRTGNQLLPALELGTYRLEQIPIQVPSLLEKAQEIPQPLREPTMVPYLKYLLIGSVGIILALTLLFLLVRNRLHSVLGSIWERYRGKGLYRQLQRKLERLERELSTMEPKTFYTFIQENLRHYLSHRWTPKMIAYTTTEIGMYIGELVQKEAGKVVPSHLPMNKDNSEVLLLEIFRRGDAVRFAGAPVDRTVLASDLRTLRQVVQEVERTFWEKRRKGKG